MNKSVLIAAALAAMVRSACAGYSVTVVGAPWVHSGPDQGFYHAFLCVATELNSGIKEDCYGFYPINSNKAAIGGPGKIDQSDIRRIGPGVLSTKPIPVTDEQRKHIFLMMKNWESHQYQLNVSNCIDFADSVLRYLDKKRPPRSAVQTPEEYVKQVVQLNGL